MLRGLHDTRVPMLLRRWAVEDRRAVRVILGFPLGLGGAGIWMGLATGENWSGGHAHDGALDHARAARPDAIVSVPR